MELLYHDRMKPKPQSPEYKAFENVLGKVLTVSKTELNQRLEQEKREKQATIPASRVAAVPTERS
jgi:hypothetical protein